MSNQPPQKNTGLRIFPLHAKCFLYVIPYVTTYISVTLILCIWAKYLHINISLQTLKILIYGECSMFVYKRVQMISFRMRWHIQNNPTWLGRSCFFIYNLLFSGSNFIPFVLFFEFKRNHQCIFIGRNH